MVAWSGSYDWKAIRSEVWNETVANDPILTTLKQYIREGWPGKNGMPVELRVFFELRDELSVEQDKENIQKAQELYETYVDLKKGARDVGLKKGDVVQVKLPDPVYEDTFSGAANILEDDSASEDVMDNYDIPAKEVEVSEDHPDNLGRNVTYRSKLGRMIKKPLHLKDYIVN
ncbi:hypothetical protein NDU88_004833 [Pleurodeles waltl]|uniref:Uncharacterized protein n=1 Tax=Pleurodeles waltl TaxID=8319 RepID=A0AAV7RJB9_PLEWA|nr:hypothetical protein NDU88_004833 [Pleurodeles waltl]